MKNNRKLLIAFIVLMIIAAIAVGASFFLKKEPGQLDEGDTYDHDIVILNKTHPVRVLTYGDEILFRPELKVERIDRITEAFLAKDKNEYERVVLIINDFSGKASLDEEALDAIKAGVDGHYLDYYYLGTEKTDMFTQKGLWDASHEEDSRSIGMVYYISQYMYVSVWTEYDEKMSKDRPENLGQVLVSDIVSNIKSVN